MSNTKMHRIDPIVYSLCVHTRLHMGPLQCHKNLGKGHSATLPFKPHKHFNKYQNVRNVQLGKVYVISIKFLPGGGSDSWKGVLK